MTSLEIRDPRVTAVVGPDVTFEKIAGGCLFTEGPLWHPRERFLLWSDMPGDHLRRWSAADGVTTFREPCGKSNGLTWDREGRLLACEHATSQVTVTLADGSTKPLATHWNGQQQGEGVQHERASYSGVVVPRVVAQSADGPGTRTRIRYTEVDAVM